MRNNINKVSERGERLDSLQDKTDNLAVSAQGFRRGANRVRKQMWWKDMKMRMCLIIGIIILLIVIIVPSGKYISQPLCPSSCPLTPAFSGCYKTLNNGSVPKATGPLATSRLPTPTPPRSQDIFERDGKMESISQHLLPWEDNNSRRCGKEMHLSYDPHSYTS